MDIIKISSTDEQRKIILDLEQKVEKGGAIFGQFRQSVFEVAILDAETVGKVRAIIFSKNQEAT